MINSDEGSELITFVFVVKASVDRITIVAAAVEMIRMPNWPACLCSADILEPTALHIDVLVCVLLCIWTCFSIPDLCLVLIFSRFVLFNLSTAAVPTINCAGPH